jgi:hypothetical protein
MCSQIWNSSSSSTGFGKKSVNPEARASRWSSANTLAEEAMLVEAIRE